MRRRTISEIGSHVVLCGKYIFRACYQNYQISKPQVCRNNVFLDFLVFLIPFLNAMTCLSKAKIKMMLFLLDTSTPITNNILIACIVGAVVFVVVVAILIYKCYKIKQTSKQAKLGKVSFSCAKRLYGASPSLD